MKYFLVILSLITVNAFAENIMPQFTGRLFEGHEAINHHFTGKTCRVRFNSVSEIKNKSHCYDVTMDFGTESIGVKKNLTVSSQVTNKHLPSFQTRKTCSTRIDGEIGGEELFDRSSTEVYTRYFTGMHKEGMKQFDYFLKNSSQTLLPQEASLHILSLFTDKLVECLDLRPVE